MDLDSESGDDNNELVINEKFAASFEARESEKLGAEEESSDDEDESEEDDEGLELTPELEGKIYDTILKIRKKDPKIYDKSSVFFEESEAPVVKEKKEKPLLLRDVLLEKPTERFAYDDEQRENRDEFKDITVDDFELVTKEKKKEESVVIPEIEEFKKTGDADDAFLADLKWRGKKTAHAEEEDDEDSGAEDFEAKYNFRFEESTEIATHPRNLPSMRRKDERRKIKRKLAALRKEKVKRETGLDVDDDDFDPDQHDKLMAQYAEKGDSEKPTKELLEGENEEGEEEGTTFRFKYKSVQPNDFGLTTDEILDTDEKDLKQLVPVKRLAPYRDSEFNVTSLKRKKWRQSLAKRKREEEEERKKEASQDDKIKRKKKKKKKIDDKTSKDDASAAAKKKAARLKSYGL